MTVSTWTKNKDGWTWATWVGDTLVVYQVVPEQVAQWNLWAVNRVVGTKSTHLVVVSDEEHGKECAEKDSLSLQRKGF